jgi:hypothetical protein
MLSFYLLTHESLGQDLPIFMAFQTKRPHRPGGGYASAEIRVRPTRQLILIGNRFDELLKHVQLLASGEQFIPESLPCDILAPAKNRGEEVGDGVPGQVIWERSIWLYKNFWHTHPGHAKRFSHFRKWLRCATSTSS